jgi:hypothetical protein
MRQRREQMKSTAELMAELMEQGVLLVPPVEAARILRTSTRWLRHYAKRRPDRLTKVPWGERRIRYRMDQVIELSRTGLI